MPAPTRSGSGWTRYSIPSTDVALPLLRPMPRRILVFLFLLTASLAAHCQQFYDRSGSYLGEFRHGYVYDRSGSLAGRVDSSRFYNREGSFIGEVREGRFYERSGGYVGERRGNRCYDRSGGYLGEIRDGYVYDRSGSLIGSYRDVPPDIVALVFLYGYYSLR